MTPIQTRRSRRIIHGTALVGGLVASGLAQIPASDNLILVPMEVLMVIGLGRVFNVPVMHSFRTSVVIGTAATMVGRGISEFLFGWIPVFGNLFDALTAIGVIEILGWIVANEFGSRSKIDF